VSHNKLVRVASIATKENEKELVEKAKGFSNRTLEVFVKDCKNSNDSIKPKIEQKSLHVQTLELDADVEKELAELQQKGIDINQELRGFLENRKKEIEEEKEKLSQEATPTKSNYIKVAVQRVLQKEHGTKCSVSGCNKDAEVNHHICRFSISKTHDPKYLAPLCKEHHQIAHSVDLRFNEMRMKAG
jgi:hypothetical protein